MGCQTDSIEEEKDDEYRAPDDDPGDLADWLYERWRDEKTMAEAAES